MKHISDPRAANVNIPAQAPSGRICLAVPQQNIPDGFFVKILFDTITPGFTDGIEDLVNHRILPGVAGWYQFNAALLIESLIDGCRYCIDVTRNGTVISHGAFLSPITMTSSGHHITLSISDVCYLTAFQYLEVGIDHEDVTEIVDVLGVTTGCFLSVQRVR